MKHNYFKHLFMALLLLCASVATAYDFKADGFIFNITDSINKTVEIAPRTRAINYKGDIVIPENVTFEDVTYSVTSIGYNAFWGCADLTSIEIPNSVTSIGQQAFDRCSGLTSITIPNSVTSIGELAFLDCTGLASVTIGNSVTSIGNYAFSGCTSLKELHIEDGEGKLSLGYNDYSNNSGEGLFYDCPLETLYIGRDLSYNEGSYYGYSPFYNIKTLTSVTIGNSVTSIGKDAFSGCSGLESIEIPNSVTSIGYEAFSGCTGLKKIELNCATIGSWFSGRSSIEEVVIGNSVTSIGEYAFNGCSGLTSITIPNSVTSIGNYAFYGCTGLKEVHISDLVAWCSIDFSDYYSNPLSIACNLYLNGEMITDLVIPEGVADIKAYVFSNCDGLTSVTIPNSVTSIGDEAFSGCTGLTSIEIPNSVTSIGYYAFMGCTGLTSITSYIQLENIIYNAPNYLGLRSFDICTIYVPYGTAWAYERDMFCKNVVEMAMTASNLDALYNEVLEYASAIIDDNEFKSHGVISDSTQLSTNAQEKTEGPISNLLDSDIETFFHSSWSSESDPVNGYHYLQVDLGEALDAIEIKYSKRMNNTMKDYNPEYVEVTATNDADGEWTLIGNYHWDYNFMTDTVEAGHATYVMDNAYRHVRITVKRAIESYAHLTTPPFFNLSEFGVWKSDFDASHPTYSGVPAMLMDELQAAMAEAKEKLSAREHSEATFNRLKKAFEDVVEFKTTGVEEVKSENGKVKGIYDLTGRKIDVPTKGIYIINGKKILVK